MNKLSAVVLAKNEAEVLEGCLASLAWCDEILVIDDDSIDETGDIALKYGCKVYTHKMTEGFAAQRNFGIIKAKNDWVFFVDADEIVSVDLRRSIENILEEAKANGYKVVRQNFFLGKPLYFGEWGSTNLVRIGKKGSGEWRRQVHEYWDIKLPRTLEGKLLHIPKGGVGEFIKKLNTYSSAHSQENAREGKSPHFLKVLAYPVGKFFTNFILRLGVLDGTRGFVMSALMSFHSFLSWSKLWYRR